MKRFAGILCLYIPGLLVNALSCLQILCFPSFSRNNYNMRRKVLPCQSMEKQPLFPVNSKKEEDFRLFAKTVVLPLFAPRRQQKKTPGPSLAKGGTGRLEDAEKIRPRARTCPCPPRTGDRRNPRAGLPSGCRRRCRFRAHRPARRRYNRKQCRRNVS